MRKTFHQRLIHLRQGTRNMFLLGLSTVLLTTVLLFAGCEGQPVDRNEDLLTLFAGELDNGSLVEACQELAKLCQGDQMGCAAFELFCGGDTEEVICNHLGQTCTDQNVGCDVFKQQCERPEHQPGENQQCCELAQQCLADVTQHPCQGSMCDPALEKDGPRCEGDAANEMKGEGDQGEIKCEGDADGTVRCRSCWPTASGEVICEEISCDRSEGCELPEWIPESCERAIQVCSSLFTVDELLNTADPYQIVAQVCANPEPIDPSQDCCQALEQCINSADGQVCESTNGQSGDCLKEESCQQARDLCGSFFPGNEPITGNIYSLFEQICRRPTPPPQEGECCELAGRCFEVDAQANAKENPSTGNGGEICGWAMEACKKEFPDNSIGQDGTMELKDFYYQVCRPVEPPPPPQDNECCAWAQMCVNSGQNCADSAEKCEETGACEQLMQKCGVMIDPADPEWSIKQACRDLAK